MSARTHKRGDVVGADLGNDKHYWVIVSNNSRNAGGGTYLACRITSKPQYVGRPATAQLQDLDALTAHGFDGVGLSGTVLAFRVTEIPPPQQYRPPNIPPYQLSPRGHLSPTTMAAVDDALRRALAL